MTTTEEASTGWNHAICERCWNMQNPDRWPVRVNDDDVAYLCCYCGGPTWVGIFVRDEPDTPPHCHHEVTITRAEPSDMQADV